MNKKIKIIGGGLAGCEAAWQAAERGVEVILYEMRPQKQTPAHKTGLLAELVCSNSLKSDILTTSHGLLKEELRMLNSFVLSIADQTRIPAGQALAVDREKFATTITAKIEQHPNIQVIREEVREIPETPAIIATGPLTSDALYHNIAHAFGAAELYFYDAISPIISAESIDSSVVFAQSRYDKGNDNAYLNCPFTEEEYDRFYDALINGKQHLPAEFERGHYFESCMPIEEIAERGKKTLVYGPMKPIGLTDPKTGKRPFAVVQLRPENKERTCYNLVGFQTQLKIGDQKRIFRMIPGLEDAEFYRYGSIHRNSYINSPKLLTASLQTKQREDLFFAGQLTGVEGYVENIATGLMAGINMVRWLHGKAPINLPVNTAMEALLRYITTANPEKFQPMNVNFGLLPPLKKRIRNKKERKKAMVDRAIEEMKNWMSSEV
jgi:methylenetetrahydrofolate--tRNA-(uracil-5-)-methyltransferase